MLERWSRCRGLRGRAAPPFPAGWDRKRYRRLVARAASGPGRDRPLRRRCYQLRYDAARRRIPVRAPFDVDDRALAPLFASPCWFCDRPPPSGVDRADSSRGYQPGNVLPACKVCNAAKSRLSVPAFLRLCLRVALVCCRRRALFLALLRPQLLLARRPQGHGEGEGEGNGEAGPGSANPTLPLP